MKKKYQNLTNKKMNLQIERYRTMSVSIGVGSYPSEIADKYPSIFKLIEDKKVSPEVKKEVKKTPKVEEVLPQAMKKEAEESLAIKVKPAEKISDVKNVKEINYARLTHTELKGLIHEKNINIDGKKTSRKMIEALEANDEERK